MDSSYVAAPSCPKHRAAGAMSRPASPCDGGAGGDPSGGEGRRVVGEMDFFSTERKEKRERSEADVNVNVPDDLSIKKEDLTINMGLHVGTRNSGSEQSTVDDGLSSNEEDREAKAELAVTKAELGRISEENLRLKSMLSRVTTNYNSLHMHLLTLMHQRNPRALSPPSREIIDLEKKEQEAGALVPRQFMSLGSASLAADEASHSTSDVGASPLRSPEAASTVDYCSSKGGAHLLFGKDVAGPFEQHHERELRRSSPERHHLASAAAAQGWIPNKVPKFLPAAAAAAKSPEQVQEATMRKARVSVRARSEAPMISDGCQWRKYGQKMAKGNPCPRAYYRCTMAAGCPVRKQVQRCAEDRSVLITTYEGNHNHPLPPAAMPMASTTSAAASMLLSGSMPTADGSLMAGSNFLARAVLPCSSSVATISASAPFPTITLDLTQPPASPPRPSPPPPQLQAAAPHDAAPAPAPLPLPLLFGQKLYDQAKLPGGAKAPPEASALADTVSAATAAITSDPNFTAVLAAVITSYMGGSSGGGVVQPPAANGSSESNSRDDKVGEQN